MVDQRKHNKDCMACLSALGERPFPVSDCECHASFHVYMQSGHFLTLPVNKRLLYF